MLKKLLLTMSLMAVFIDPCYAKGVCSTSKYKILDDTIAFGTTQNNTLSQLEAKYGKKGRVFSPGQNYVVVEFSKPHNNIKRIAYMFTGGVMSRVMFEYSTEFISSLGGTMGLFKALYPKLKDKYGEHNNMSSDEENDQARFEWYEDGGLAMNLIITGHSDVTFRFDCNEVERKKHEEATKSANFGF